MKDWVANKKPSFMSVAYQAERSIEDELDRTSQSDVITVAISYCIMLAYIAIALGEARSFSRLLVRFIMSCMDESTLEHFRLFNRLTAKLPWASAVWPSCCCRSFRLWVFTDTLVFQPH